jgi:hypothetical protein
MHHQREQIIKQLLIEVRSEKRTKTGGFGAFKEYY